MHATAKPIESMAVVDSQRAAPRTLGNCAGLVRVMQRARGLAQAIPDSLIALLGRCGIAAVFWQSGQTKVEGFALNPISGDFTLGWPRISDSALALFRDEYRLPLLAPGIAAPLAAFAEHLFPVLLLLGLATRLSAAALLGMTAVIQFLVYPGAYATHAVWATVLLVLIARGPGKWSLDHWFARRLV